jgi:DUF2075 family protein
VSSERLFEIEKYPFGSRSLTKIGGRGFAEELWPIVYILSDKETREAYIGETVDVLSRFRAHLKNPEKKKLDSAHVISSEQFHKSITLDLESSLIKYMSGDGCYHLLNGNLGLVNHNYYGRQDVYDRLFVPIWERLRKEKLVSHTIRSIDNSDLFKYSPYKSLSIEQKAGLQKIISALVDPKIHNTIVQGGAGTGKTLLAVFLFKLLMTPVEDFRFEAFDETDTILFDQIKRLKERYPVPKIALVIPMSSFRATIKKVFGHIHGLKSSMVIGPSQLVREDYDLIMVDEAHRLRRRVNLGAYFGTFDRVCRHFQMDETRASELDWIFRQSKKRIFLYDEYQSVRPSDVHHSIFDNLKNRKDTQVQELKSQFRVKGGNRYVKFVDDLLRVKCKPGSGKYAATNYELYLFDNIKDMVEHVKTQDAAYGLSRLIAGYAWEWKSRKDATAYDIEIGRVRLKWNRANIDWVNSENSVNEVGCIHTTQGYDLNYAGVIFGNEISYDPVKKKMVIHEDRYFDKNGKQGIREPRQLEEYIIHIYKTIMLRGIRGTYVYVCNDGLREYFARYIHSFSRGNS